MRWGFGKGGKGLSKEKVEEKKRRRRSRRRFWLKG